MYEFDKHLLLDLHRKSEVIYLQEFIGIVKIALI